MTDTTVSTEKPPPTDPRPPCEVCGSQDHTKGYHDSESPTGYHDSSVPVGYHDSSVPVETGGTTK